MKIYSGVQLCTESYLRGGLKVILARTLRQIVRVLLGYGMSLTAIGQYRSHLCTPILTLLPPRLIGRVRQ